MRIQCNKNKPRLLIDTRTCQGYPSCRRVLIFSIPIFYKALFAITEAQLDLSNSTCLIIRRPPGLDRRERAVGAISTIQRKWAIGNGFERTYLNKNRYLSILSVLYILLYMLWEKFYDGLRRTQHNIVLSSLPTMMCAYLILGISIRIIVWLQRLNSATFTHKLWFWSILKLINYQS